MSIKNTSAEILSELETVDHSADVALDAVRNNAALEAQRARLFRLRGRVRQRIGEIEDELAEIGRQIAAHQLAVDQFRKLRDAAALARSQIWKATFRDWIIWLVVLYVVLAIPLPRLSSPLLQAVSDTRIYSARVAGAIPIPCYGDAGKPTTISPDDFSRAATPLTVQLLESLFDDNKKRTQVCQWYFRADNEGWGYWLLKQLAASVSLEVGIFQKVTLLLFLLGWREIRAIRLEQKLAEFVLRDEAYPNPLLRECVGQDVSLFPRRMLTLASAAERGDPYSEYTEAMLLANKRIAETMPADSPVARLIAYVTDVLVTGRSNERPAGVSDFANAKETQYKENLLERFWLLDYLIWFLPTIGFLGTIYGISQALVSAKNVFESGTGGAASLAAGTAGKQQSGQFAQVVNALGTAFDTTGWALFLLAFLFYMQKRTESQIGQFGDRSAQTIRERLTSRLRAADALSDVRLRDETRDLAVLLAPTPPPEPPEGDAIVQAPSEA